METVNVKIISSSFGYIEALNIIIFALTLIVAVANIVYTIRRNKCLDNNQNKIEQEAANREVKFHLTSIKSYWFREIFLNSILDYVLEIDGNVLSVVNANETVIERKKKMRAISRLIIDTIYTRGTDPKLIKKLIDSTESFENKFYNWAKQMSEKDIKDGCNEYKRNIIDLLYEYERNDYTIK